MQPLAIVALAGIGAYYGLRSYRLASTIDRVQFLADTVKLFLKQDTSQPFWQGEGAAGGGKAAEPIDAADVRGSAREIEVEVLLFRNGTLGRLLRERAFGLDELATLYAVCRRIFVSRGIRDYLRLRQLTMFDSDAVAKLEFPDALYLNGRLTKAEVAARRAPAKDLDI